PRELAQLFADELATQATTRAAYVAFAALGLAGAGFAVGWVLVILEGTADITSAAVLPVGLVAAFALIACPQISFAAGLLALLRGRLARGGRARRRAAERRRRSRARRRLLRRARPAPRASQLAGLR